MENSAVDVVSLSWGKISLLMGGSGVISGFVVWFFARLTPYLDSYFSEGGKITAQFKKIDTLVAQNERLTAATETIKTKLTDETWDRQQRWTLKQTVYRELLVALDSLYHAVSREGMAVEKSSEPASQEQKHLIEAARATSHECDQAFYRVAAGSVVCISKEAHAIVQRVRNRFGPSGITVIAEGHILNKALADLSLISRRDLGYEDL